MRLRNNPNASKILNNSQYIIKQVKPKYFDNNKPVHVEIGTGKGDFIIGMARQHPEINFIGVEKFETILVKALTKLEKEKLTNVLFLARDAKALGDYFTESSVNCIYLNFSDPWPKKRHYKRRLTYQDFLEVYDKILINNGYLKQKTDNKSLFESSIVSFNNYGLFFETVSLNLHHSEQAKDNVMSEYEKKFSELKQPIYAITVRFFRKEDVK